MRREPTIPIPFSLYSLHFHWDLKFRFILPVVVELKSLEALPQTNWNCRTAWWSVVSTVALKQVGSEFIGWSSSCQRRIWMGFLHVPCYGAKDIKQVVWRDVLSTAVLFLACLFTSVSWSCWLRMLYVQMASDAAKDLKCKQNPSPLVSFYKNVKCTNWQIRVNNRIF